MVKQEIIPSVIAKNQKALDKIIKKVKNKSNRIQLDVMDKKFVKNSSLDFDFKLPKLKQKVEAHLMVKGPKIWIESNYKKVNTIIFHIESTKNPNEIIELISSKKKKVEIAIKPLTPIAKISRYIPKIDMITVMSVHPGKYGAKFIPSTLKKVTQLRKKYPKLIIEVDGGINDKTISKAKEAGANYFISGSFLKKEKSISSGIRKLKSLIK